MLFRERQIRQFDDTPTRTVATLCSIYVSCNWLILAKSKFDYKVIINRLEYFYIHF